MLHSIKILSICIAVVPSNIAVAQSQFVRPDGFGPVKVGMSLAALNRILHTSFSAPSDPDEHACFYVDVPKQAGVALMILNGRVARVDVNDNIKIITVEGIHVGDSENRALQAYGKRVKVTPHAYVTGGHYLTIFSSDKKYGIRYESEDGAITRYYAGTAQAISFIEGCE